MASTGPKAQDPKCRRCLVASVPRSAGSTRSREQASAPRAMVALAACLGVPGQNLPKPGGQLRPRDSTVLACDHPFDKYLSLSVCSVPSAWIGMAMIKMEWDGPQQVPLTGVIFFFSFLSVYKWAYVTFKIRGKFIKVSYSKLFEYQVITHLQEQWTLDPEKTWGGVVRKSTPDGSRWVDSSCYFQRNWMRITFVKNPFNVIW